MARLFRCVPACALLAVVFAVPAVGRLAAEESQESSQTVNSQPAEPQSAESKATEPESTELVWQDDYASAWKAAQAENKLLFILFGAGRRSAHYAAVEKLIATDELVQRDLHQFVLVKLPLDHSIQVKGEPVRLLGHAAFSEMQQREGIVIIDLKNKDKEYYGHVVSEFPFMDSKYYHFRSSYLPTILTLPPGTLTQRSMVWAVRVHPEHPASTKGTNNTVLVSEAKGHSTYQAEIGVQGHQRWDSRFMRIMGKLGVVRQAPVEVVAESWPNQTMLDSCVDCVASWRQSSGHWNAVKSYHGVYGYDIKKGNNGIWYGTGIFAN